MSALQRRIAVCFAVVASLATVRGVVCHLCVEDYILALSRLERSHGALMGFEAVFSKLNEAETAQRGYLITGKDQEAAAYHDARTRLEQERRRLDRELAGIPTARAALDELRPLVDSSLAAMDQAIDVRRREGFAAAERLVRTEEGTRRMARLRETARALGLRERRALEAQLRTLMARASWASGFTVYGTGLALIFLAVWYRLIAGVTVRRERDLSRQNAALDRLARIDPLTALPNRRQLDRALDEWFAASVEMDAPLSLVVLDVDGFKWFNDTFGHPAGDETLRRVAAILRETVREPDLVARYGGEEFAVLLRDVDGDAAVTLAERLRSAITGADWPLHPLSASFGVATRDASTPDPGRLVSHADRALYHAKARGRNRVSHYRQIVLPALESPPADPAVKPVCA